MRHELEDAWRLSLESKQHQYHAAKDHYMSILRGLQGGMFANSADVAARAREAESQALAEYTRVLQVFTALTIHRKAPEEEIDPASVGGGSIPELSMISIVDDDESVRTATRALLRSAGYQAETFASAELFLGSDASRESACVILDLRMPGMGGLELQGRLNAVESKVPIIFVSAHDSLASRRIAIKAGAVDFFSKPFDGKALVASIERAIRKPLTEAAIPKMGRSAKV
jgi:CheY-like chemotaxis protein